MNRRQLLYLSTGCGAIGISGLGVRSIARGKYSNGIIGSNSQPMSSEYPIYDFCFSDDFLYTVGVTVNKNGVIQCTNKDTKAVSWTKKYDKNLISATIANDILFVGTIDGNILSIDAAGSGSINWKQSVGNGKVTQIQCMRDRIISITLNGYLTVLDRKSGREKYSKNLENVNTVYDSAFGSSRIKIIDSNNYIHNINLSDSKFARERITDVKTPYAITYVNNKFYVGVQKNNICHIFSINKSDNINSFNSYKRKLQDICSISNFLFIADKESKVTKIDITSGDIVNSITLKYTLNSVKGYDRTAYIQTSSDQIISYNS